jgi:hypothetical protein
MTGAGNADDQASDSDSGGGWDDALADLAARKAAARSMGGAERLAKHRSAGKLDVRARVAHLLDPGSFLELGTLVGGDEAPADAIVMGSGRIDSATPATSSSTRSSAPSTAARPPPSPSPASASPPSPTPCPTPGLRPAGLA